jgi:threonine dehydratase
VGLEIAADCPDVGTVCVPVGGGGLSSGVATAVKALVPAAEVVTVEPEGAPKFHASRQRGERVVLERTASIADGLITLSVGALNYRHLVRYTDRSALVSDDAMREAVRFAVDRLKLVLEPSGAAALAWLLAQERGAVRGPVVAVLSGGNIEWEGLRDLLGSAA